MRKVQILLYSLLLLILEYKKNNHVESISLVDSVLSDITIDNNKIFEQDNDLIVKLKTLIKSIINDEVKPDKSILLNIEMLLSDKSNLLNIINKYVSDEDNIDNNIKSIKSDINKMLKKTLAIKNMSIALNRLKLNTTNPDKILLDLMDTLDKIKEDVVNEDVALVDEVNFSNKDSLRKAVKKAKDLINGGTLMPLKWECVNRMLQGGIRRGEFCMLSALPHNYKSGMTKSFIIQQVLNKKPVMDDIKKKPTIVFITLEEEIDNIVFFIYSYLKFTLEGIEISNKDKRKLDDDEMTNYVEEHLLSGDYDLLLYRFKPELFTYSKLFTLIERLERSGREIHATYLDYVKKMSRDGCRVGGPSGTDLLELFSRLRNFFSSKKIAFITPHQLSTRAKQLLSNGVPSNEFSRYVVGKGLYADSSQLDQEVDIEIFLHIFKQNRKTYLGVSRGKHRISTNIPEEYKHVTLEFKNPYSPIPHDTDKVKACVKLNNDEDDILDL